MLVSGTGSGNCVTVAQRSAKSFGQIFGFSPRSQTKMRINVTLALAAVLGLTLGLWWYFRRYLEVAISSGNSSRLGRRAYRSSVRAR